VDTHHVISPLAAVINLFFPLKVVHQCWYVRTKGGETKIIHHQLSISLLFWHKEEKEKQINCQSKIKIRRERQENHI